MGFQTQETLEQLGIKHSQTLARRERQTTVYKNHSRQVTGSDLYRLPVFYGFFSVAICPTETCILPQF